jgi:hypothetical protein
VAQAKVQEMAVLLFPVTTPLKSCVLFVITLEMVGEIAMVTVEEALLPHPNAPSATARVSIKENFHQLIPVLPRSLNFRPRTIGLVTTWSSGLSIFEWHILKFPPIKFTIKTYGSP